jgi:excinuclease UvrABC ATPase subunit
MNTEKTYSCEHCEGRGFFVIEHYEQGKPLPNEVKDCESCDGTGLSSPILDSIKDYTSVMEKLANVEKS